MGSLKIDRSGSEPSLVPEWLKTNNNGGVGVVSRHSSSFVNRPQQLVHGSSERESRFYPNFSRGRFSDRDRDREAWNRDWRNHDRQSDSRSSSGFYRVPVAAAGVAAAARLDVENGWNSYNNHAQKASDRLRMVSQHQQHHQQHQNGINRFASPRNSFDAADYVDAFIAPKTPIAAKMPDAFISRAPEALSSPPAPAAPPVPKMSEALASTQTTMESQQTQRLEEIALKQSRLLVPMKPSLPKAMVLPRKPMKSSDLKSGSPASPVAPYRTPAAIASVLKTPPGRLQVLGKESAVPAANRAPPAAGAAAAADRNGKVGDSHGHEERKPLAHSQNRSNFYNAIRKKAASNGENRNPQENPAVDAPDERKKVCDENPAVAAGGGVKEEAASEVAAAKPAAAVAAAENGRWCEKKETAFLRALGWEDKPGKPNEAPLTEDEIYSFVREHMTALASTPSVISGKNRVVCSVLLDLSGGSLASSSSSSSSSESDCEFELGKLK